MSSNSQKTATQHSAQALLTSLRNNYVRDLPAQLDEVEGLIMILGSGGEDTTAHYEDLYRRIHSLKGTAGTYGLQIITAICHQFEDYLTEVQDRIADHGNAFVDNALQYLDLLRNALALIMQDKTSFSEIETALSKIKSALNHNAFSGMLIDTSKTGIDMTLQILADSPIQFTVVSNGVTALQRLLYEPFDLLITGMEIPDLNGVALISALRLSRCVNSQMKTLLISSRALPELPREIRPDRLLQRDAAFITALGENVAQLLEEINTSATHA